jgi:hypothetical protein
MEGAASIEVASADLPADIEALESNGFRLELIFPADAPRVAELAVPGVRLRLDTASGAAPASIAVPGLAESVVLSGGTSRCRRWTMRSSSPVAATGVWVEPACSIEI